MKRKYISPEFVYARVELYEILTSSVENYSGYIDPARATGEMIRSFPMMISSGNANKIL